MKNAGEIGFFLSDLVCHIQTENTVATYNYSLVEEYDYEDNDMEEDHDDDL